ncbi:MAG: extracellular solute-binding protein [Pseudomonadales bacterium]|nr:extracellular solute-binding protein [Pseudomonadales bacterium]
MKNLFTHSFKFYLLLIVTCMGLGLAIKSVADEKITLRLLTWEGYVPEDMIVEFQQYIKKKYGKTVIIDSQIMEDINDIFVPIRTKQADIWVGGVHILEDGRYQYIKNKLILPLNLDNIPNFKYIPEHIKSLITIDGQVYAIPIAFGPFGLAYNTQYFSEPPTSWNVLWDEKYKGKYSTTSSFGDVNIFITALALGYDRDKLDDYKTLNNHVFKNKLRKLVENAHSFWPGTDEAFHLSGLHLSTSWGFSITGLNKQGENWKLIDPEEGSPYYTDIQAIGYSLKDKPLQKKIAEEWLNFIIGKRFQSEVIATRLSLMPVVNNVIDTLTEEQIKEKHLNDPNYAKKYIIPLPSVDNKRDRNGLIKLWTKAMKGIEIKERERP